MSLAAHSYYNDDYPTCFLCGRNGMTDPLERHHVFGGTGGNKPKSEKYGAIVYLCKHRCHNGSKDSVHKNVQRMRELHQYWQRRLMVENNWTEDDFRAVFGVNYLRGD